MLFSSIKGKIQLEGILHHLEKEGIEPCATKEELYFVWSLFKHSEDRLRIATRNLEELSMKDMEEMKEVRANIKF